MERAAGMPIRITGTGAYLPETVLTNAELQAWTGLSDKWILSRSGIRERRVAGKEEAASGLGLPAARALPFDVSASSAGLLVALLVPHQANLRIIEAVAARLPLPMDRVVITIDYTGNCSGASFPPALDAALRQGRLRAGEVALLAAFGGGLIWGAGLVRM